MIKAIIFDCFGVVVTFGFHSAFTSLGGDLNRDKELLGELFGLYNAGKIDDNLFLDKLAKHLDVKPEVVKEALAKDEHLDMALLDYIKQLKTKYKIGMLSNIGRGGADRYFGEVKVRDYFDDMVLSGEVGIVKPDPAIYELAASKLGVEPNECVFVDDGEHNCNGARQTGMKAIKYTDVLQLKIELEQILSQA